MIVSSTIEEAKLEIYEIAYELSVIGELMVKAERFPTCASSFGEMLAKKADRLNMMASENLEESERWAYELESSSV